jgi:putative ABC transport system substrate-binding protein
MSTELSPKRLGILKELIPEAKHYAVLVNPLGPSSESIVAELRAAASGIGRQVSVFAASNVREIDTAYANLARDRVDAVVVSGGSLFTVRKVQIAMLAAYYRLPAIYYDRRVTQAGGLMSYGASITDAVRQAAVYTARILKGEKPADLPVLQATKFEFVVNLHTARMLGLVVPSTLLATADEVIE